MGCSLRGWFPFGLLSKNVNQQNFYNFELLIDTGTEELQTEGLGVPGK